mgnify:CR=1 FL=1
MEDLTQRQIDILKAIIQEYTDTGEPVGSEILEKKYKLGVSPATIRNEMVELAKKGYLKKEYFSSGRIPSAKGFRFFIKNLMKEKELATTDEVAYKNSIWDDKDEPNRLLYQATKTLSRKTGFLSLAATDKGDIYYSGVAYLLERPEFFNIQLARNLFLRLEEAGFWERIINEFIRINEEVIYLLGEEDFYDPLFESCGSVFGEFEGEKMKGIIGVIGPKRMPYAVIIPQIRYFSNLIDQLLKEGKF